MELKLLFKDELIVSNFICNLFYSMAFPIVHFVLVKAVGEKMISLNLIILSISGIIFPLLWNKYSKLYNLYGFLMISESLGYIILGLLIYNDFITAFVYFIIDTILFALLSKNVACGATKLLSIRYNSEKGREKYDNNSSVVGNFSSLLGFIISFFISIPINYAFILMSIGIIIDNVFYYRVYRKNIKKKEID